MDRAFRVVVVSSALVAITMFGFVVLTPTVSAATRTWTTDTDWNDPDAVFLATEVIGTGVPAKVEILKDAIDWVNRLPAASPGWREGASMAFAAYDNIVVLFGGYNFTDLDQTWEYDYAANLWTQNPVNPHPPRRSYAGMSYDPVNQVMVLYGGVNTADPDIWLTDTWEYDVVSNTWAQTGGRGSGPMMYDVPLAYDASAQRHILIGWNITNQQMETWAYDPATDAWTNRNAGSQPVPRSGHATAYHAFRSRTVLFGGTDLFPPGQTLADTWEYDYASNLWFQLGASGPTARTSHAMAYRPQSTSVLLFGGQGDSNMFQDTWRFTSAATWEAISPPTTPSARRSAAFTYDDSRDVGTLYGGTEQSGQRRGDTWALGAAYRVTGKYASGTLDSGAAAVDWQTIWWNKTSQPPNTYLRFQIATSNSPSGPWDYVGPTGTVSSYYTTPGSAIWSGADGQRYLRFLADFGSMDTQQTPSMEDVGIGYTVPSVPPYIVSEDPVCPSFTVPMTTVPRIIFSESMNRATVFVNFSTGTPVTWNYVWSVGDSVLDLQHAQPFGENQVYRLLIQGRDLSGDPLTTTTTPGVCDGIPSEPWIFVTDKVNPTVTVTNPAFQQIDVPLTALIVVTFSEPMNPASVTWNLTPFVDLTPSWSVGDSVLTLSHTVPFPQCRQHTALVNGTDKAGLLLVPGTIPNPWTFSTFCINPYIETTIPASGQTDVPLDQSVIVNFHEPMNTASVQWQLLRGPPTTFTPQWSNGNRRLTLTHPNFPGCAVYEMRISGNDVDGYPLIPGPPGSAANPWTWVTLCSNPYVFYAVPADGDTNVSVVQDITIWFSEMMNPASVVVDIQPPITRNPDQWQGQNTVLVITHTGFMECLRYRVRVVSGTSGAGFPLVPGAFPNPWSFDTICESPYVLSTDPADGDTAVPLDKAIVISFNEPMVPSSVIYPTLPAITLTPEWSNGDRTLTLRHTVLFIECQVYEVSVDGQGQDGRYLLIPGPGAPNSWTFTTRCPGFYITREDPADGEQDVPLGKSIVVEFSEAVDTATFNANIVPSLGLNPTWSAGDTVVTLDHPTPFTECVTHTVTITAKNRSGGDLQTGIPGAKPNPWSFRAVCVPPEILLTDPADGDIGVSLAAPIIVTFSERMLRSSVTWNIVPGIVLTSAWTAVDTILTLSHSAPFQPTTLYTVTISGTDLDGIPLGPGPVPNPWSFTTSPGLSAPGGLQVLRMPPNGIRLTWRAVPDASEYVVYGSLNRFAPWPWPQRAVVTTTFYDAPNDLTDGLTRYYIVRARDFAGSQSPNSTMGVKLPITVSFSAGRSNVYWLSLPYRSAYKNASDISDELTGTRIDVVAKWDAATQRSILWYYIRGGWEGTDFAINPGDGIFIGVRAGFSWVLNGTDGDNELTFALNPPPQQNFNWISLPLTSTYRRASDIVLAIEGSLGGSAHTKIEEVARWDPLTQTLVKFSWSPTGWSGTDFSLVTGEGIYLKIVASFAWTPDLITPEVP